MKKIFLLSAFLFTASLSHSQVLISLLLGDKLNSDGLEFGLEGGFNWSNIGNLETSKRLSTFNLGFYFDIRLKDPWYLYTGVLVKSKLGVDRLSENDLDFLNAATYQEAGDYSQAINYFLVPALINYKFKNHMYVEAGPQVGLMYKAWVEYNSDIEGKVARIREDNKDQINRLDAGVMAGAGYKFLKGKGLTLGLKYYYGFANVYKERTGTNNQSLFLKANLPIGAKKPKTE